METVETSYRFSPIGVVRSPFKEKFGIPRQPGLIPEARGQLIIFPPYHREEAFRDLTSFSHIWIVFVFHQTAGQGWRPTVRPPRLGGNRRVGVFASRSNFRPNPIGLSAAALTEIDCRRGRLILHLNGIDLLDGTPVLDIKPYLPYADAIPQALGGFASEPPPAEFTVAFTPGAESVCRQREADGLPGLSGLITQLLRHDPRPGYYGKGRGKTEFGMRLYDLDVRWAVRGQEILVTDIRIWKDNGESES